MWTCIATSCAMCRNGRRSRSTLPLVVCCWALACWGSMRRRWHLFCDLEQSGFKDQCLQALLAIPHLAVSQRVWFQAIYSARCVSQVGPPIWALRSCCHLTEQFNHPAALKMNKFNGGEGREFGAYAGDNSEEAVRLVEYIENWKLRKRLGDLMAEEVSASDKPVMSLWMARGKPLAAGA